MYTTRQLKRTDSTPNSPFQVTLDYFKKLNLEPTVVFQQSLKQKPATIQFKDRQNNVLLAIAYMHITSRIAAKRTAELLVELNTDMKKADLSQLSKIPEQHESHLHIQTLTAALLSAVHRTDLAAADHEYRLPSIRRDFAELLNMFPYVKFALVVWVRCRTLNHLKQEPTKYLEAMGNETTLLGNYSSEIRGVPLEMVCNCMATRLEVAAGSATEQLGRMVDPQVGQHRLKIQGSAVLLFEQGESDKQTETTAWSRTQTIPSKQKNESIASEAANMNSLQPPTYLTVSPGQSSGRCIKCIKHCRCAISTYDRKATGRECRSPKSVIKQEVQKPTQGYSNRKNLYRLGCD